MPCLIENQASCEVQDVVLTGLIAFGIVFVIDSAVRSYLILAYSQSPQRRDTCWPLLYGGRLTGTVLSGWLVNTTDFQVVDVYGTKIAFLSHTG